MVSEVIFLKKHKIWNFGKHPAGGFETVAFDPDKQYAVIRSSICTGEKVAGFKDKSDGHFYEVMLIRTPKDLEEFKETYGVDKIKTEY